MSVIIEDKISTRDKLINCGARIFAEKGYTNATTREICLAAGTNITSIHYYFKDKAGLYRTIFAEPFKDRPAIDINSEIMLNSSIHEAFYYFYQQTGTPFLSDNPLSLPHMNDKQILNSLVTGIMKQEQSLSTGLVDDLVVGPAKYVHEPLLKFLCHHLKVTQVTDEIHRLAFTLGGLTFLLLHPKRVVEFYAPNLLKNDAKSHQQTFTKLADFATAILEAEIAKYCDLLR